MPEVVGPFVGHYHDRVYCCACAICQEPLILLASHTAAGCFLLALCETCDAPTVALMWGDDQPTSDGAGETRGGR